MIAIRSSNIIYVMFLIWDKIGEELLYERKRANKQDKDGIVITTKDFVYLFCLQQGSRSENILDATAILL